MSQKEATGSLLFETDDDTDQVYKRMLQCYLCLVLRKYLRDMIFQQDAAPTLYVVALLQCLNHDPTNRWIDRTGPVTRIPVSPELTTCDYVL